jgi:hypothetical protein
MSFIGYELDSVLMEARLPAEKWLQLLSHFLHSGKQKIRLRDLQSINQFLNFTCAVIVPGRAFLRRMIDLTIGVRKPFHFIRITKSVLEDMFMWEEFLTFFNGHSMFLSEIWVTSLRLHLYTSRPAWVLVQCLGKTGFVDNGMIRGGIKTSLFSSYIQSWYHFRFRVICLRSSVSGFILTIWHWSRLSIIKPAKSTKFWIRFNVLSFLLWSITSNFKIVMCQA